MLVIFKVPFGAEAEPAAVNAGKDIDVSKLLYWIVEFLMVVNAGKDIDVKLL